MRPRFIPGLLMLLAADMAYADNFCFVDNRDLRFGIYDPTSPRPNDANGSIGVRCNCTGEGCGAIHYSIAIVGGDPDGVQTMLPEGTGGIGLRFLLFSDPARTVPWADGDRVFSEIFQPSNFGTTEEIPIYGRIPPLQSVAPGRYSTSGLVVMTF